MSDEGAVPREAVDDERRSLTQPGGHPGFSLPDRVLGLEYSLATFERHQRERETATETRLREGAESFSELRRAVAPSNKVTVNGSQTGQLTTVKSTTRTHLSTLPLSSILPISCYTILA